MEWRISLPNAEVFALPAIGSDHSPILVHMSPPAVKRRKEFKIEAFWMEDEEYDHIVRTSWHSNPEIAADLAKRIKYVAAHLTKWSRKKFSNASKRLSALQSEIQDITNKPDLNPHKNRLDWLKMEVEKVWRQEEAYWGMRSRVKWLQWGDRNTKFFHATTVQRRQRNRISALKNDEGQWSRDPNILKHMTAKFFKELYQKTGDRNIQPVIDQIPCVVTDEINQALKKDLTLDEVTAAAFQLGATKAPGPDGLTGKFFHQHWEFLKGDIFKEILQFLHSGNFNPELNKTLITLIPKIPNPEKLEQFRPISLCNFVYKIIAKTLANRLKKWLPGIISEEQSAFVEGRQIQDNILIVQEVLHQLRIRKRKKKFHAVLKLDMKKAFDRVEWDFLAASMLKMGFDEVWVAWIMKCVSSVSFSIKMNGEPLPQFQPTKGIRQGDPLSPYLFIITANVLSSLLKQAVEDETIKGLKLNRHCPTLSHLLFADDLIMFLEGKISECQNVSAILNQYCYASGQAINLNKSGIFFSKDCPRDLRNNMANELRIEEMEKTGKYLGIPTDWGISKKQMFAWVLDRVNKKLEGWKENFLSKAGKEILLKTVVQALPQYAMTIFKLPFSICRAIERKISAFWWKNGENSTGVHWKNWATLKTSKAEGGLGFRDLIKFNEAMLGRQAWRLLQEPASLWSRIFKGLYYPSSDFLHAEKNSRPSWGWQSMLVGRKGLGQSTRWLVGNGAKIKLREDVWLPRGPLGGPGNRDDPTWVSQIINKEEACWNIELIETLFDRGIVHEILAIPLNSSLPEDRMIWTPTKTGNFTVKSAYRASCKADKTQQNRASTSHQTPRELWSNIWAAHIPPKLKHFAWQICQNSLATRENLHKRQILPNPLCQICQQQPESIEHLLLFCPRTRKLWSSPEIQITVNQDQIHRMDDWFQQFHHPYISFEKLIFILWQIWRARNDFIFRGRALNPQLVLLQARAEALSFHRWNPPQPQKPQKTSHLPQIWTAPSPGVQKINIDGSFEAETGRGAAAYVCRNSNGVLLSGRAKSLHATSALQTEAEALLLTLDFLAGTSCGLQTEIETDCLVLVELIRTPADHLPWDVKAQITEAQAHFQRLQNISLTHCSRDSNQVADWIAKAQNTNCLPANWVNYPPPSLFSLLVSDFSMYPSPIT